MHKRQIVKWTALLLVGPAVGTFGSVMWDYMDKDTAGLIAGVGWLTAAVVTTWFVIKVFRTLPVRYSVWAMVLAIPLAVVSALMHGLVYALTGQEEPFFFILAIFAAPLLFIGGVIGAVIPRRHPAPPPSGTMLQPR
jgi:hypothetical protein